MTPFLENNYLIKKFIKAFVKIINTPNVPRKQRRNCWDLMGPH